MKETQGNVGQSSCKWHEVLSTMSSSQGQPGIIRARHIFQGAPLCSRQVLSSLSCVPWISVQPWLSHHTRNTAVPSRCLIAKRSFCSCFLSAVLAPKTVEVLIFTLLSKHGNSSGYTHVSSKCVFVSCLCRQGGCR